MTSIEFLNGLNGVEDFRAENEQIFLQQDQWNKLFKKSDIELLAAFPEEDSTLKVIGQTVFVCKFAGIYVAISYRGTEGISANCEWENR